LFAETANGQDSEFIFDAFGNLTIQTGETVAAPQIIGQPRSEIVGPGDTASFSVVLADTRGVTYQWLFNGSPISGATGDAVALQSPEATNEGQYAVVLSNGSGGITSNPAMLWWDGNGNGLPDSWELAYFGNLTNTASGDFDHDGVSNLQEFWDGTNPTNSASARYRITLLCDGGTVTITPNQPSYTNGQNVTLGCSGPGAFNAWSGAFVTRNNPLTITMTTNITLFAHFLGIKMTWTNSASGDWDFATNWNPNLVPELLDSAFVTNSPTITVNSNTDCSSLNFGTIYTDPVLTGSGILTLHGSSRWTNGTMSGTGQTIVAPGASLTIDSSSEVFLTTRVMENQGLIVRTGTGLLTLNSGAYITNDAGALFDVQSNSAFYFGSGAAGRFDNTGTFLTEISSGTATFDAGIRFTNYGNVTLESGMALFNDTFQNNGDVTVGAGATLAVAAGGSANGIFDAESGSQVEFTGGTFTVNPSGQFTGAGGYQINIGAALACNANISLANLVVNGTLTGTGVVTINGAMNWTGGTMSGKGETIIAPGSILNINSIGSLVFNTRTLENAGTTIWTNSGLIELSSGAVITNDAGGLFDVQNAANFIIDTGTARFDNAGEFLKEINPGTTTFSSGMAFNNYGAVTVQTGNLLFNGPMLNNGNMTFDAGANCLSEGNSSASGMFTLAPTSQMEIIGGTFTLNPAAQIVGMCNWQVTNEATLTCNTGVSVNGLSLYGYINGTGVLTVNGLMSWTQGTMSGSGRTVLSPSAKLSLTGSGEVFLTGRVLENQGLVVWTNSGFLALGSGAVITNDAGALFDAQNASTLFYENAPACRFDNSGTFRKELNSGTTSVSSGVQLNNFGLLDIERGIVAANGGFVPGSASVLHCVVGGTTAGSGYGQLQAAGSVALAGALSVALTNGFLPATNNSFTVLSAGSRNGAFASFSYPSDQVTMQLSNTANSVIVQVTGVAVPPPALLPSGSGISGSNFVLSWSAVSNTTYRVEYNPALASTNWTALPGDVTASNSVASKSDPLTPSNRFYRIVVIP
jgi:hypothetical protein